jgi:hypothetical protein
VVAKRPVPRGAGLVIGLCVLVTIGFGVVPGVIQNLTDDAVPVLVEEATPSAG